MSSVPMSSSGNIAGLGVVGCNAQSESLGAESLGPLHNPQTCTPAHLPPNPPVPSLAPKIDSDKAPPHNVTRDQRGPAATTVTQLRSDSSHTGKQESSDAGTSESLQPARALSVPAASGNLHRIREVREQQGISVRSVAKRLGIAVKQYKQMEQPTTDLSLSELLAIQGALEIPLVDLLVENNALSRPVEERAKLVKTMKTAVAIREAKSPPRVGRLAEMLCEQLVDLMPELSDVSGWPQFGARRGKSALGKALSQPIDTTNLTMPPE